MAEENNNTQLKLDQLTEAVKGLYAKSSMSQGEIYNALTSLSQRYENLTNVSSEKIVSTIITEFRKSLETQYNDTGRIFKDLEAHLKNFVVQDNQKLNTSIEDFLKGISALYQKIEVQQNLLKDTVGKIENLEGENISLEVNKLSENFTSFSKGFENITTTLNKNFADFLEQIRRFNSKDEINAMKAEILSMTTNVNNAVSSIQAIDNKYVTLSNLIETITKKESEFSVAIDEFVKLTNLVNSIKNDISQISTKEDFENFGYEIKEKIENIKTELKKLDSASGQNPAQANQLSLLTNELSNAFEDIRNLRTNFTDTRGEIAGVKNSISSFDIELKELKGLLETRLPSVLGDSANEMYLENTKEELKSLIENLSSFKEDIKAINEGNIEILQAPIEKALESLKNQDLGKSIEGLKTNLNNVTDEIQASINNLQTTLSNLNNVSSIQLLTQISDAIPAIADRLEIFRNQTISENNANLNQIKESLNRVINAVQMNALSSSSTTNSSSSFDLDILSNLKSDILEYVSTLSTTNKTSHSTFENKLDKLIHSLVGNINSIAAKPLNQALGDIDSKIEKTNLQQIHNAKELLEEIQNGNTVIKNRLINIEEGRDLESIITLIAKIEEKINGFNKSNDKITDEFKILKEQIAKSLKENVQKISAVIENPQGENKTNETKNTTLESLLIKIQEYISNFEFLKDNISQEIKENLKIEFGKVQGAIKKLRTTDENSNYNYTLEDVESDLAKIRLIIEKNSSSGDDFRNLFEKIVELRTVGLENVKINRDVETEINQMSGWFKDTVDRLDDVTDKLDDIQNIGFEDIKTRLLQSEKSRTAANEFNTKIENALKHLIKNVSSQENKIAEFTKKLEIIQEAQKDSFNPSQFIDIFYENMTQTKMLTNRVEIIEDKINTIQNAVEKLISYVEN